jgi:hypothetical protein
MATVDYKSKQATATRLITKFGSLYKLIRIVNGVDTVIAYNVPGTMDKQLASLYSSTGGGVIASDKKVIYVPVILNGRQEPLVEDHLDQGSKSWTITEVDILRPDGSTVIFYTCTVT